MSVTIIGYQVKLNKENEEFITLELQGELEMALSSQTGHYYATARKCFITSTFDEATAQGLIGKQLPGKIEKVSCAEYLIVNETTGEARPMDHRYEYFPENAPVMKMVATEKAA